MKKKIERVLSVSIVEVDGNKECKIEIGGRGKLFCKVLPVIICFFDQVMGRENFLKLVEESLNGKFNLQGREEKSTKGMEIAEIIVLLETYFENSGHQRLGQLIVNAVSEKTKNGLHCPEIFHMSNKDMHRALKDFIDNLKEEGVKDE